MPFVATPISISQKVEEILRGYAKSRTLPLSQIQRAEIIIEASEGRSNRKIADEVRVGADCVSKWRMRWAASADMLCEMEEKNPQELEKTVESLLKDSPRPGCPCNFTEVQILQILEIACRNPADYGYETSHWSTTRLAKVVVELGIVDSISPASVNRFLKYRGYSAPQGKVLASLDR